MQNLNLRNNYGSLSILNRCSCPKHGDKFYTPKKKVSGKKVPLDLITGQRFYSSLRCVR